VRPFVLIWFWFGTVLAVNERHISAMYGRRSLLSLHTGTCRDSTGQPEFEGTACLY